MLHTTQHIPSAALRHAASWLGCDHVRASHTLHPAHACNEAAAGPPARCTSACVPTSMSAVQAGTACSTVPVSLGQHGWCLELAAAAAPMRGPALPAAARWTRCGLARIELHRLPRTLTIFQGGLQAHCRSQAQTLQSVPSRCQAPPRSLCDFTSATRCLEQLPSGLWELVQSAGFSRRRYKRRQQSRAVMMRSRRNGEQL